MSKPSIAPANRSANTAHGLLVLGLLLVTCIPQRSPAQDDQRPAVLRVPAQRVEMLPVMPLRPARGLYQLDSLVLAKLEQQEGTQLIFLVEQYRTEERDMTVTRRRLEKRTRTVTVVRNGQEEQIEQPYTVTVEETEQVKRPVQVPAGKKPTVVAWEKLRAYRLDGTSIEEDEIGEFLAQTRPVFLVSGMDRKCEPASELIQQAMVPGTIIVFTDALGPLPKP